MKWTKELIEEFHNKGHDPCFILECGNEPTYYNEQCDIWLCDEHFDKIWDEVHK